MTEAMRECALLGIPGVPGDADSEEAARFVRRWVTWIGGWIAGEVFTWLGMYVDDDTLVTPWAMELAERYARFGFVTDQAVAMLQPARHRAPKPRGPGPADSRRHAVTLTPPAVLRPGDHG